MSGGVEIKACLPLAVSQAVHPEERGIFLNFCLLPSRCPKSAKLLKVKIQQQIRLNRIANALSTNINDSIWACKISSIRALRSFCKTMFEIMPLCFAPSIRRKSNTRLDIQIYCRRTSPLSADGNWGRIAGKSQPGRNLNIDLLQTRNGRDHSGICRSQTSA